MEKLPILTKYLFQDDFTPPIYNVWREECCPVLKEWLMEEVLFSCMGARL